MLFGPTNKGSVHYSRVRVGATGRARDRREVKKRKKKKVRRDSFSRSDRSGWGMVESESKKSSLGEKKEEEEATGFELDFTPTISIVGGFRPVLDLNKNPQCKECMECLQYALNDNNNNSRRPKLENPEILKATTEFVEGYNYFITFKATNIATGTSDIYQTAVFYRWTGEPKSVFIFRPKKPAGTKETSRVRARIMIL
ncbi:hypothetical protein Tsubulata_005749 [Turnera subulata]|uniref:Cystatin domain-containing protein n=1 Tax=Turnera subulata TaxID=218843 RepID=A0A9Q0G8L9_9ROSI|nr:hypothetical protein Tsubulata_005749 [Turnera subulata]